MKMGTSQQYCLRWNNHRSNLLTVFDQLLQNEAFTDVTLACDGGAPVKCHKMVLAACSPYFQYLFTDLPCRHPVVVLKDVKYADMKAILEYMYRGEVNVAHDQLAALLKVAEALRVKGLVEENGSVGKPEPDNSGHLDSSSPPRIGTSSAAIASVPHSSISPPHSTHSNGAHSPGYNNKPYGAYKNHDRRSMPMWPMQTPTPPHPHAAATAAAMLSSCYDSVSSDMSPLRRKKLQSLLMSRDTPILRTVLGQGQGQVDSSQPVPLIAHADSNERVHFNGNSHDMERGMKAEPSEDAASPYTDISTLGDDDASPNDKCMKSMPASSPQSDMRSVSSAIANYVPQQKPEWKRYKQYTRNDILSAIEAVRNGMSALQAARKYGVPSRTLYDKVKKLGITTTRLFKRGSNGGSTPSFPYSMGMFGIKNENEESLPPHSSNSLLEPMFLQQALERGKQDYPDREALMALASAHAQAAQSAPNSVHNSSSPEYKWHGSGSMTPSPNDGNMDDDDQVEDLSVNRKEPQHPTGSVIVPPMSHFIKTEDDRARMDAEDIERERDRLHDEEITRLREDDDRTNNIICREMNNDRPNNIMGREMNNDRTNNIMNREMSNDRTNNIISRDMSSDRPNNIMSRDMSSDRPNNIMGREMASERASPMDTARRD